MIKKEPVSAEIAGSLQMMKEVKEKNKTGLTFKRFFTNGTISPYDEIEWELRTCSITSEKGEIVFEQKDVEVPKSWSQLAANIAASKYFYGQLGTPEREHSVRQLVGRVVDTIVHWGVRCEYFKTEEDARIYSDELTHILLNQKAAFNSPVWFNLGVKDRPQQASACFINSVDDTMISILDLAKTEGMLFRGGSGTGTNFSTLRSSREKLSGGGTSSGPLAFIKGLDTMSGSIKSGGKCFKEGTLVATTAGWAPIETLRIGDLVLTHKGPRPVADFMPNGLKQCYRVRTREGYEVEVTRGHKFAYWDVLRGAFRVKPIEEFALGESLYVLMEPSAGGSPIPLVIPEAKDRPHATTTMEMQFPTELNEELAYAIGLMYGDADLRTEYPYHVRVSFAKDPAGRASAERFRSYCTRLFGEEPLLLHDDNGYQVLGFTRKRLVDFLVANGLAKGKAANLGFPTTLFQAHPEVRAAFIAGVIDADGTYQRRGGWSISSIDRAFLIELQRLLLTLGSPSKLRLNREGDERLQPLYRLSIIGHTFVERLVQHIAPHSAKAVHNYVPSGGADKGWGYCPSLLPALTSRLERRGGYKLIERRVGQNETTGYGALACLVAHPHTAVANYADELSRCVQVILESVEPTEIAQTYDIEVEDVHLLSANGFYASNTRRAAKMTILNIDHPDIEDFIKCKAVEEKKAWALIDAGYNGSFNVPGGAYDSIGYQNANHSVRVTDEFMQAYLDDGAWRTRYITTGKIAGTYKAKDLMKSIAESAWICGDPGMQYDTTINRWHTCKNTDRIHASNPCSEFVFLDNTSCNLSSVNLMKFQRTDGEFDVEAYKYTCRIMITAQEIIVDNASYPTERITQNSHDYRPLGLGYANLGALLMARGVAYDSDAGRALAGALTAIMTGEAYHQSAIIARDQGWPFSGYERNREPMLGVMHMHRAAVEDIDSKHVPAEIMQNARSCWDNALALGEVYGYRNAQATVLAPTGTIGFLLGCDTTGVEPDIAIVKYKSLVGGGVMKIVNNTVPAALKKLGYGEMPINEIVNYIDQTGTIEGAPHLKSEHLPVFDCAFKPAKGTRSIHYMGHIKMMAAVQPFISGAISKTVNVPQEATVDEIMQTYIEGWRLGLKAIAIYRDGSKRTQPLNTASTTEVQKPQPPAETAPAFNPVRRKLPVERRAITHKFSIAGHEGYITVGMFDDGTPGEIFLVMAKEGSTISGLMDAFATAISMALQYGVPLKALIDKFSHVRFEPSGYTGNAQIPYAKSIMDYIFRWLALKFLPAEESARVGVVTPEGSTPKSLTENGHRTAEMPGAFQAQSDAPTCADCGSIMVRNGACYKCMNCGETSGCS
jgi:ribonucleoside-diphosphate reductase alpha chain